MIEHLAIIGVGLIGGSLAKALRRAGYVNKITGYGRRLGQLELAVKQGVIDEANVNIAGTVRDADMVVIATPVGVIAEVMAEVETALSSVAVVTDVGSVKANVITQARTVLSGKFSRFVPGHPIAGTENSGVESSYAELFDHRRVVLTPEPDTDRDAVSHVQAMWEAAGADVASMAAAEHDVIFAACSHAPHLLAYSLVDTLVRHNSHQSIFEFAAGGFYDFTRIASSNPEMWRDICLANREAIVSVLRSVNADMERLIEAIEKGDDESLLDTFKRAKHARDQYINKRETDA